MTKTAMRSCSNPLLYEISLSTEALDARCVRGLFKTFTAMGIPAGKIAESRDDTQVRLSYYTSSREEADAVRHKLSKSGVPRSVRAFKILRSADWLTKWKRDFQPVPIARGIRIVPLWLKKKVRASAARDIYIDSTMAFGTGMHPTTRAMAGFIAKKKGEFDDFLDIGTGTGILSLIAAHCGARVIWSVDIAPDAIDTALRNFAVNRCRPELVRVIDFRNCKKRRAFSFVAANILAPELIAMRDAIIARVRPGKYLAVSGIWGEDAPRFRSRFETKDIVCLEIKEKDGWMAILYQKCTF